MNIQTLTSYVRDPEESVTRQPSRPSRCNVISQKAKDCLAYVYGDPYPPLSQRIVARNYCCGISTLLTGTLLGGLALYEIIDVSMNPDPRDSSSPGGPILFLSSVEFFSFTLLGIGGIIIDKTRKAPRLNEHQPLLS